ncbi:MAG: DUF177 domain-containing protein [Candidatus Binatia bacterium]
MRIRIRDIEETTKELVYDEPTAELNPLLEHGPVHDFEFLGPARVALRYYRSGQELFLDGTIRTDTAGHCARCLSRFEFCHEPLVSCVLVPRSGRWASEALDGGGDDQLMWYEGEEVDVSPIIRERLMLTLPTLPLCREDCRGLCPRCGADHNTGDCDCVAEVADPRFAVLRSLRRDPN